MTDQESPETGEHKTLAEALLAAQIEMPAVERDGDNPHFSSKFTTLDNLLSKVKPVLNRHGLVLTQAPDIREGNAVLHTEIIHAATSEALEFDAPLDPGKPGPQAQGAAITYMRRYSLAAALAIADQEDDDGGRASASGPVEKAPAASGSKAEDARTQIRRLRDEIRALDPEALPDSSFDTALEQREHSEDRLVDFAANLTELLADIERFVVLATEVESKFDPADAKKAIEKANRRASRRERVESLEKTLADEAAKGGSDNA